MKATEVLMEEHRVIERVLAVLETGANQLEAGEDIQPEFFLNVTEFVKGFADGCHHVKEEKVLFIAMQDNGLPKQGGPIAVMLAEHEQGRVYTRALREAAQRLGSDDQTVRKDVIDNAKGYVALLKQHIHKEDHILFPMANQVIPGSAQEQVWDDFERVEHEETGEGVHEKYLAMVLKMEQALN